jgi:hypothetical protein
VFCAAGFTCSSLWFVLLNSHSSRVCAAGFTCVTFCFVPLCSHVSQWKPIYDTTITKNQGVTSSSRQQYDPHKCLPSPLQHKLTIIRCLSTKENRFLTNLALHSVWRDSGNWHSLHLNITQQVLLFTTASIWNTWILLYSTAGHVSGVFPHDTFPYLLHIKSEISRYTDKGSYSVWQVLNTTHFLSYGLRQ